jgi:hypothetical protein
MPSMMPTVSVDAPSAVTGKSAAALGSGELLGLLQTSVAKCLGSPRSSKSSRLGRGPGEVDVRPRATMILPGGYTRGSAGGSAGPRFDFEEETK